MAEQTIRILNWDEHYETAETRKLVRLRWVPLPNTMGRGYAKLMARHGYAGLGVWACLLETASRKHREKRDGSLSYTLEDLALESRGNLTELQEILPTLREIGWISLEMASAGIAGESPGIAGESADEGKGREGRESREGKPLSAPADPADPKADEANPEWLATSWNTVCGTAGMQRARLPIGKARRKKIAGAMAAAEATKEQWRQALLACASSKHWCGQNDRSWRGSLDSFLAPAHRDRWLDAGVNGDGEDQLEKLAREEAAARRVPVDEIRREWGMA